jgi:predicted nucleic acid-binding protein
VPQGYRSERPASAGGSERAGFALIVVDASAVLEVLLNTPGAARVSERLFTPGETLHAPHLIDHEVAQVLRRYARTGEIDAQRGSEAITDLAELPLAR